MYRVIIWGPGEVGGAGARAAWRSPDVRLVGATAFGEWKDGAGLPAAPGMLIDDPRPRYVHDPRVSAEPA